MTGKQQEIARKNVEEENSYTLDCVTIPDQKTEELIVLRSVQIERYGNAIFSHAPVRNYLIFH